MLQDKNADKLPNFQEPSGGETGRFCAAASEPSEDQQGPAYRCTLVINGKKNLFEDPEVLLAAELGS